MELARRTSIGVSFGINTCERERKKSTSGQREKVGCDASLPPSAKSMGLSKDEPSGLSPGSQNWIGLAVLPHQSSEVSHPQKGMSLAAEGLPAKACALAFPAPGTAASSFLEGRSGWCR